MHKGRCHFCHILTKLIQLIPIESKSQNLRTQTYDTQGIPPPCVSYLQKLPTYHLLLPNCSISSSALPGGQEDSVSRILSKPLKAIARSALSLRSIRPLSAQASSPI